MSKIHFHNTVKPHFTDTGLIRTPRSLLQTVCFVPGKECLNANVEKTGTSQRRNNNSFNNNKSLAVQDESDMNTPQEENTHVQYTTEHNAAGTTCWHYIFSKFNLNSTDNLLQ